LKFIEIFNVSDIEYVDIMVGIYVHVLFILTNIQKYKALKVERGIEERTQEAKEAILGGFRWMK